ncbi:MAG: hypothetical protein KBD51_02715 [Candidatus Levybacteria bacterium]|nr:hypothetical protein [Candidatus Levybacteria bacterium]
MIRERLGGVKGILAKSAWIVPAVGLGGVYGASMIDHSAARTEYQRLEKDHTLTVIRRDREQVIQENRADADAQLALIALGGALAEAAVVSVLIRPKEQVVFQSSKPNTLNSA